jgi:hypothetical protein
MPAATCVQCGQTIPGTSKLADVAMPESEARERNWQGTPNPDGTVTVKLCIQCQVNRAEASKQRSGR